MLVDDNWLVIDSAVFLEVFKEAPGILRKMMIVGGCGLGFLIATGIAIDLLRFCLLVKPL